MASEFEEFCGSPFWNDTLTWASTWPHFTDCFVKTALVWGPCAWLWVTLPIYLVYLMSPHHDPPIPINWLNVSKTFMSLMLSLLCVVDLINVISLADDVVTPQAHYLAPSLKAATLLLSAIIIQFERIKGLITSGILFIFFSLLVIADVVPFYTNIELQIYDDNLFDFAVFYLYYALLLIQFVLHCFAERVSRHGYYNMGENPSPETKASFLSRITFNWLNTLVLTGYKKALEASDLWDLHPRDKSERVVPQFQEQWDNEVRLNKTKVSSNGSPPKYSASETTPLVNEKSKGEKVHVSGKEKSVNNASLFKAMVKVYLPDIMRSWACKFIYDLLQFVSPILLNLMIGFVETETAEDWNGYIYAAGFFFVAIIQSLFFHAQFHIGLTLGMRIRSALISAVYRKAITMNSEAKKKSTVGEIVNLMSVDCQRVQDMTGYLWMLWSSPLQIALAIYMLWQQLGVSVMAGLAVLILLIPINGVLAFKSRRYQVQQMKFKDERLKLMTEVLNGMKVLKLYAWELSFQEKILAIRNKELDVLKKNAYLNAFSSFCWTTAPYLVTLATFATYVQISESHFLDAQKAFVALSLFNILRFPINLLPMMVSYVVMANVSIVRIGKFLRCTDLDEHNVQRDVYAENAITVENGTFTWDREIDSVLHNINFKAPVGQLVAVVGTVGAGKSSLISAILGEMEKISGRVNLKGSVAYVPQQAWVQNATLKDNILFAEELDQSRYERVLEACALGPDLEILPGGDQTEIGEKGINLSGGQKQRVSLARAVYNNADVYLLDDPLSAVDSHVGKHIFEKVIGEKGMLRDKTRVLVTHGVHWLPMVDNIIVIVDGRITEMGSYDELMCHDGAFAQFLKMYLTKEEDSDEEEDDEVQQIRSKMLERLDSVISEPATTSGDEDSGSPRRRKRTVSVKSEKSDKKSLTKSLERELSKVDQTVGKKIEKDEDKLIQEEKSETGKVKWKVFGTYARYIGVTASLVIVLMYFLYQVASVYANVWLSQWTEDPYLNNRSLVNTSKYQETNNLYLGVYGGLGIAQAVIVLTYSILCAIRMVAAAGTLHKAMLENILRAPMEFFDTTPIGRIVNRFSRDIETIDNNLPQIWRMWVNTAFSVISTLVVISYSTPIFLAVILPIGFLYFLIQRFYVPTSRQLKRLESTTRSPIYSHFSETITGASTIRAYDVASRFKDHSQDLVDKNLVFYFGGIASNRWLGFRLEFCGSIIVLSAAIFAVISRDTIEGGIVGLSISYALQVTGGLNWMVRMTSDLETNIVSVERVQEYSETPTEADWYLPFKRPPRDWPDRGTVEFHDYTTRYRPGLDLVLKGITCEIGASQKVGIVGRTGAGKSSLTVALFRLIESAGGSIVIDGYRISDMGLHDLRSKLTILPQDPVLFSGTLRMNLDPFDQYNDILIWQALEHAHLKKFVQDCPDKLDHECGEGGQNLSVGQRQLVCLARTLLRKTKILILDEATAAVDMETDDLIQQTIRTEFKDCTVLTIAHRLNTIMDYDRVIVMDQGLIKEFDSPDNLLKDHNSIFYGMAKDAGILPKSSNGN